MDDNRDNGLVAWQWASYGAAHRDKKNLLLHALTAPLFVAGIATLPLWLLVGPRWLAAASLAAVVVAVVAQGTGHRREATAPAPFRGPLDVMARLFTEQFVNFPRYVFTGHFTRSWRAAREVANDLTRDAPSRDTPRRDLPPSPPSAP